MSPPGRPKGEHRSAQREGNAISYLTLRFDVDAARAEAWSDALLDAGVLAVDVSDPAAGSETSTASAPASSIASDHASAQAASTSKRSVR